jgi:hypothetical protein
VLDLKQKSLYRSGCREAVPSVGVNGDACRGLFYGRTVAVGVVSSFLAGGQVVASDGGTRLLSGPSSEANCLLRVCRPGRADLRGVLHPSRINFRYVFSLSVQGVKPVGRPVQVASASLVTVSEPVVGRCGAPLMFKHRPGVRRGLKSWVCGCFGWEGRQALRRRGGLPSPVFRFGKFAQQPKGASTVGAVRTSAVFSLFVVGGGA